MVDRDVCLQVRPDRTKLMPALVALVSCLALFCGCREKRSIDQSDTVSKQSSKPLIIAESYPLEYLTQRIAGEFATVRCPVPEGRATSEWKPNRDEILQIQSADMIVVNGIGAKHSKWLDMASLPANKVCNSATRGLALRDFIEIEDVRYTHSHGPEGEHSHATNCAYTWLHPVMAQKQAKYIADELSNRFPKQANEFSKRYGELSTDLKNLQSVIEKIGSGDAQKSVVLTSNPDLKFFTRAFGWDDIHLKWFEAPSEENVVKELQPKLDAIGDRPLISKEGKSLMISSYEFNENTAKLLESKGIAVIVIDKMDIRPAVGDYLFVMEENVKRLQ